MTHKKERERDTSAPFWEVFRAIHLTKKRCDDVRMSCFFLWTCKTKFQIPLIFPKWICLGFFLLQRHCHFIYRFSWCNLQLLADTNSKLFNIFNNHSRVSPSGCPTVWPLSPAVRALGTHPDSLEALDFKHWLVLIMCWLVDCKPKNLELSISAHHRWKGDSSDQQPGIGSDQLGTPENTNMTPTIKPQEWSNAQGLKLCKTRLETNPCRYLTPNALCSEVLGPKVMERYGKSFPIVSQWHPWFPTVDPGEITAP